MIRAQALAVALVSPLVILAAETLSRVSVMMGTWSL